MQVVFDIILRQVLYQWTLRWEISDSKMKGLGQKILLLVGVECVLQITILGNLFGGIQLDLAGFSRAEFGVAAHCLILGGPQH